MPTALQAQRVIFPAGALVRSAPIVGDWILAAGAWDDGGVWNDAETWNDS